MIVDCHTHVWESIEQLGRGTGQVYGRPHGHRSASIPRADIASHLAAAKPVDKSFVLAFKSHYLEADVPNAYVARYVRQYPDRLIGFAGLDPSRPKEAIDELRRAHDDLGMRGVTIWPAAQDFHPASSAAMRVYAEVSRLRLPMLIHQDIHVAENCKMEFARPYLVDEIAREFPDLKIVIAQLGYPWTEETIALLCKHRNVFADISGLLHQPWAAYNALVSAYQAEVMDALLFGSDFPYGNAAACIEALYRINQFCHGTNLPTVPREQLRLIVERDVLKLLDIESDGDTAPREPDTTVIRDE
ncbi:MAG: amidohydrolase [Phycisphaerae bacterium]|nr:amidohydrolase [Phycisphaerae bacterium]